MKHAAGNGLDMHCDSEAMVRPLRKSRQDEKLNRTLKIAGGRHPLTLNVQGSCLELFLQGRPLRRSVQIFNPTGHHFLFALVAPTDG